MRVLIVDDEEPARRRLSRLLSGLPDVEVVGDAGDGEESGCAAMASCASTGAS